MELKDLDKPKIRIIKDFIDKSECNWLIDYANSTNLWDKFNRTRNTFKTQEDFESAAKHWNDRRIELNELYIKDLKPHQELFDKIIPLQDKMYRQVIDFFNPSFNIYSELWEFVKWYDPHFQEPHVDFIDPEFDISSVDMDSIPEECKYFFSEKNIAEYKRLFTNKVFTSMLYLNEDFEGGELYFPQHNNFSIKPEPGMLLIFSGNIENMHGIKPIISGTRYTHTTFWSNSLSKSSKIAYDRHLGRPLS